MKRFEKLLHTAVLVLTLSAPALSSAADVPKPEIPPAVKGEQCVEPTDVMRRKHMDYLMHQRDETMHRGIRTTKYSLTECLECHVPAESEAQEAGMSDEQHFCKNCHVYTGVTIDCFECHATKPEKSAKFHPLVTPRMKALKDIHQPDSSDLLNKIAGTQNQTGGAIQ